jgi:hypothetical protein
VYELKPAAWIDRSGHPKHLSHMQGVAERRLYGPLEPLYDSQTLWNACARAAEIERARCAKVVEAYRVPVGNSAAGEMAAEWTMDALREIRDAIRGAQWEQKNGG